MTDRGSEMEDAPSRLPRPLAEFLSRVSSSPAAPAPRSAPASGSAAAGVDGRRRLLEDFTVPSDSLDWRLAQLYWETAGLLPFVDDEVPFAVTSSGRLSELAAAVLFANCEELPPDSTFAVVEVGAGTGLFARYLLDAFAALCRRAGRDFYERLMFHVSDRSPRTVAQWRERDLFAPHAGHVVMGTCDAMTPREAVRQPLPVRAVFCNYIVGVLPATIIRQGPDGWEELRVRTWLPESAVESTGLSPSDIPAILRSDDPAARAKLVALTDLVECETRFVPAPEPGPYWNDAIALSRGAATAVSHGALDCLSACLDSIDDEGFVLLNDHGAFSTEQQCTVHYRLGKTLASHVSFPLLDAVASHRGWWASAPAGEQARALYARLYTRRPLDRTVATFLNRFGPELWSFLESPLEEARAHVAAGRKVEALHSYTVAMERNRRDWWVLAEVAWFVGLELGDAESAIEIALAALRQNPWYSTSLWNVLGECLAAQRRPDDAREAFEQAWRIAPGDARTCANLARASVDREDHEAALQWVARGLGRDALGTYREHLLHMQQDILGRLAARRAAAKDQVDRRAARFTAPGSPG